MVAEIEEAAASETMSQRGGVDSERSVLVRAVATALRLLRLRVQSSDAPT